MGFLKNINLLKTPLTLVVFIIGLVNYSCHNSQEKTKAQTLKVILDTDMGSDCDDVGALALLHAYADIDKVEILGCIYSSGKVPYGAGIIDAINTYYNRPEIPIGAYYGNDIGDPVDKMGAKKLARDTTSYRHTIIGNTDAVEQTLLNRKLLAAQKDTSVIYITIGHTKGLYDLLTSKPDTISPLTGYELVQKKIKRWVALGAIRANNKDHYLMKDWNFFFNGTAPYTKYLVEHFPSPIYFISGGQDVMTGKSLKDTPSGNIIRTAYQDWLWNVEQKTLEEQRPSWDLVTVYFAVEGLGEYFDIQKTGWLEFDTEKGCRWVDDNKHHNQFYSSQKDSVHKKFASYLNTMIAKPPRTK